MSGAVIVGWFGCRPRRVRCGRYCPAASFRAPIALLVLPRPGECLQGASGQTPAGRRGQCGATAPVPSEQGG